MSPIWIKIHFRPIPKTGEAPRKRNWGSVSFKAFLPQKWQYYVQIITTFFHKFDKLGHIGPFEVLIPCLGRLAWFSLFFFVFKLFCITYVLFYSDQEYFAFYLNRKRINGHFLFNLNIKNNRNLSSWPVFDYYKLLTINRK